MGPVKWWYWKGTVSCLPWVSFSDRLLELTEVPTVLKEPAELCWLGLEFVSSLAVSAFWSGKLACLIIPTARTYTL